MINKSVNTFIQYISEWSLPIFEAKGRIIFDLAEKTGGFFMKSRLSEAILGICGIALVIFPFLRRLKKEPSPRWVTGTGSATLALMLNIHRTQKLANLALSAPALIPPPLLLEKGIAPLAGESGYYSVLYGCGFGSRNLAESYAGSSLQPFDLQKELNEVLTKPVEKSVENLTQLQLKIIRILQMKPTQEEQQKLRDHVNQNILPRVLPQDSFTQERVEAVSKALITQSLELNQTETELIEKPCPLIFGSSSVRTTPWSGGSSGWCGIIGEETVDHPMILGRDIQFVYTNRENVERIRSIVTPFHVECKLFS